MPIIPQTPVSIPNQVLSNGSQPYVNQMNFGQAIGRVQSWNPDCTAIAGSWINDAVRKIYDRKTWYSLMVKGQAVCPAAVNSGTASVTAGSPTVQGVGTAWTVDMIGRQFRFGFQNPIYTIVDVDETNQALTLELPWGGSTRTSSYFVVQYYFNLGPNIKYLKSMSNTLQGYKMRTNLTQEYLDSVDPWRQSGGVFPWGVAPMPLDSDGNYIVEIYAVSWIAQALPFRAYVQPPNLVQDNDQFPPYIRADVVIKDAISKALVWRGPKKNPYYDAMESQRQSAEFENELLKMAEADENLYRTQVQYREEESFGFPSGGGLFDATHAVMGGDFWGF